MSDDIVYLDNVRLTKATEAYWAWISGFFSGSDLADENVAGKFADPDDDSADNWSEFVANTVPTNRLDYLRLELVSLKDGVCTLRFPTAPGRLYGMAFATNLALPQVWFPATNNVVGTGSPAVLLHPSGGVRQFYRVVVRLAD